MHSTSRDRYIREDLKIGSVCIVTDEEMRVFSMGIVTRLAEAGGRWLPSEDACLLHRDVWLRQAQLEQQFREREVRVVQRQNVAESWLRFMVEIAPSWQQVRRDRYAEVILMDVSGSPCFKVELEMVATETGGREWKAGLWNNDQFVCERADGSLHGVLQELCKAVHEDCLTRID